MTNNHGDRENRPIKHGLTPAEHALLRERYFEEKELQQAAFNLNLRKLLKLGEALRQLKGD